MKKIVKSLLFSFLLVLPGGAAAMEGNDSTYLPPEVVMQCMDFFSRYDNELAPLARVSRTWKVALEVFLKELKKRSGHIITRMSKSVYNRLMLDSDFFVMSCRRRMMLNMIGLRLKESKKEQGRLFPRLKVFAKDQSRKIEVMLEEPPAVSFAETFDDVEVFIKKVRARNWEAKESLEEIEYNCKLASACNWLLCIAGILIVIGVVLPYHSS